MSEESSKQTCIYCGCPVDEHNIAVRGNICGVSNAVMCRECFEGEPGRKYVMDAPGSYGERYRAWCKENGKEMESEENIPRSALKIILAILGWILLYASPTIIITAVAYFKH